jgi:ribonuclease P protein component
MCWPAAAPKAARSFQPNSGSMERLLNRRDFLAAAKARAQGSKCFVMQMRNRTDDKPARVGFTCTKKLGNAVVRNRIRRRLKEASRLVMGDHAKPGHDYVLIGRQSALTQDFEALKKDIISALAKLHAISPETKDRPS